MRLHTLAKPFRDSDGFLAGHVWLGDDPPKPPKDYAAACVRCRAPIEYGEPYREMPTRFGQRTPCCLACSALPDLFS